jgi:hypothetical protein
LGGDEILGDEKSLIFQLIKKDGSEVVSDIIQFVHMSNKSKEKGFSEKIKPLWKRLYELLKDKKGNPEYTNVIRQLCSWLDGIEKIDDEVSEWVKFSIDHIKEFWDSFDITKYLSRHAIKTPEAVGELYMYMLRRGYYPDFAREDIQRIVEALYEKQLKEKADEICRLYQARGHEFLKEIYEKNNPQKKANEI